MATTIVFANQKGGVGKTSMCLHTAGALVKAGNRVLVVDLDQQGNLSSVFAKNIHALKHTVADVLLNGVKTIDVIQKTPIENLDLLPANLSLSELDAKLAGDDDSQYYLVEAFKSIISNYDYILIDCPPSLGKSTRLALVAANGVVVPIECQDWAVKGSHQILAFVERVQQRANPKLRFLGFVINKFSPRRRAEQDYYRALKKQYGKLVFRTEFNDVAVFVEAAAARMPVTMYRPKSDIAKAFSKFSQELISHVKEKLH
jgi:chromosome partitioning protein